MAVHLVLNLQPNPVKAFQRFLGALYQAACLDALLVPLRVNGETRIEPHVVEDATHLKAADPFTPLMLINSARLLLDYQQTHSDKRLGTVMRACELRAATTLHKRGLLDMASILTVGVDCVGTFGPNELAWTGTLQPLAEEALQFARQGGINMHRYRPACQVCIDPMPTNADLTADLLGLPARTAIIISASDEIAERYRLTEFTEGLAPRDLVKQHSRVRRQVIARRGRARQRLENMLNGELAIDVDGLSAHLIECKTCQTCLNVCPIFDHIIPSPGNVTRDEVIQWLLGCAGCGMCEAACSDHLPLTRVINRIRTIIAESLANNDLVST